MSGQALQQQLVNFGISVSLQDQVPAGSDGSKFTIVLLPNGTPFHDIYASGYSKTYSAQPGEAELKLNRFERRVKYGAGDILESFESKGLHAFFHLAEKSETIIANGKVHEGEERTIIVVRLNDHTAPATGTHSVLDFALNSGCTHDETNEVLQWLLGRFN